MVLKPLLWGSITSPFLVHRTTSNKKAVFRRRIVVSQAGSASFYENSSQGRSGQIAFHSNNKATRNGLFSPWTNYYRLKEQLGAAGLSGLASYGVFNTLYYFGAYLLVFFTMDMPRDVSLRQGGAYVIKLLAIVWAGSQLTKIPRAACALACTPVMDRVLARVRNAYKLKSKRQAFVFVIVPACWVLFLLLLLISYGALVLAP